MEAIKELNYQVNKFESLGFFVEYLVEGGKLIGTKNIDENDRGCVGYESTQTHTAQEDIVFKTKKIKKGTKYYTRIYPLCGKPIKTINNNNQLNLEIMSNKIQITEAPNYSINEQGEVTNNETNAQVATVAGSVRLTVADGTKKSFKVSVLKATAFPSGEPEKAEAPKSLKFKGGKLEKVTENKETEKAPKADKAPKAPKAEKVAGEPTGAFLIREAYDKDPENFDMKKFSEESGISISRVKGCMKKYLVKLEAAKTAKAKNAK